MFHYFKVAMPPTSVEEECAAKTDAVQHVPSKSCAKVDLVDSPLLGAGARYTYRDRATKMI